MQTRSGAMTYLTHDNGGRAFKVWHKDSTVQIYSAGKSGRLIHKMRTDQFFIGQSPENEMTRFSLGFGPQFDGNSVLIKEAGKTQDYVFVGWEVYSFTALAQIVKFCSPVGNNDVPYPWAVDALGNVYLMTENIILRATEALNAKPKDDQFDPYQLYYEDPREFTCEHPFTKKRIKFHYDPNPDELFDRLQGMAEDFPEVKDWNELGKDIFRVVVFAWGEQNGYSPLTHTTIVARDIFGEH